MKDYEERLDEWSTRAVELGTLYRKSKIKFGISKVRLDECVSEKLHDFYQIKKGMSYEMACLNLIRDKAYMELYSEYINSKCEADGYEKELDSVQTAITTVQSIMKYNIRGEMNEM